MQLLGTRPWSNPSLVIRLPNPLLTTTLTHAGEPCVQAIEKEANPSKQPSIVSLVGHKQRRAAELLPCILLAKRLLGEVC